MELQLKIPLRNLFRNRRRTLLSAAIIALGAAMIYAVLGYVDFTMYNIRQGTVRQYGNFQIASPQLWAEKAQGFEYLIPPETVAKIEQILTRQPEILAHTTQLNFSGLALTERKTKVVRAVSLEPANSALDYNDLVLKGRGRGLDPQDRGKVLIGKTLAEEMQLGPGDVFTVTTTTVDGAYNVGPLQVAGVFSLNNAQAESQLVFVPISYGKTLLNTPDVTKVIVKLRDLNDTDRVAAAVQEQLKAAGLEMEVRTWVQLSEFYRQIREFFGMLFGFLTITVSVLVFFIVLQVLTLAFLERTREVGTIRALGTKRTQIFSMFLTEGALLGILGGALGLVVGWLLGTGFNSLGIGWQPPGAVEPVPVRISLAWHNAWLPFVVSVVATLFSAIYPSTHSARLRIVDALRTS